MQSWVIWQQYKTLMCVAVVTLDELGTVSGMLVVEELTECT